MPDLSSVMKTAIFFELPLADPAYAVRYAWAGEGQIKCTIHYNSKPSALYSGSISLTNFRKILDTFEALHNHQSPPALPFVEVTS